MHIKLSKSTNKSFKLRDQTNKLTIKLEATSKLLLGTNKSKMIGPKLCRKLLRKDKLSLRILLSKRD